MSHLKCDMNRAIKFTWALHPPSAPIACPCRICLCPVPFQQHPPSCIEGLEPQAWLEQTQEKAMVLLNYVFRYLFCRSSVDGTVSCLAGEQPWLRDQLYACPALIAFILSCAASSTGGFTEEVLSCRETLRLALNKIFRVSPFLSTARCSRVASR